MPPHAGWGLGLDRLAMTFAGAKNESAFYSLEIELHDTLIYN